MLIPSVSQDWSGSWIWEIFDEEGIYLRSDRAFTRERDARENLKESAYLIQSELSSN